MPLLPLLMLGGFWLVRPEGLFPLKFLTLSVPSLLSYIWLRGFRLIVRDGRVIYRNGFYRTREHDLSEIRSAKRGWVPSLGTKTLPNVVVKFHRRGMPRFWISCNVFRPADLQRFIRIVEAVCGTTPKPRRRKKIRSDVVT